MKKPTGWSELPERSVENVKRIQRAKAGSAKRGRGAPPLGPFTKKAAQAMSVGRKKEGS